MTNASADMVARELTKMFFTHSYVPKRILSDLGSVFTSKLIHELTGLLDIQIDHATLKHPQTIGLAERSHGALKRILKLNTDAQWTDWHRYVPLGTFLHNTSYYSSIGCCPSTIFHGREPIKPLNLRFSTKALEIATADADFVTALQDAMLEKFRETKDNIVSSYHRYRGYYDQKALAQALALLSFCLLLNPLLTNQSDNRNKSLQVWLPLYRVEKVLTNSNYIIRKVGTNHTQCVHRIRLRSIQPQHQPEDVDPIDTTQFVVDPSLSKYRSEPGLFDDYLPRLLEDVQPQPNCEIPQAASTTIRLSIRLGGALAPALPPPAPAVAMAPIPPAPPPHEPPATMLPPRPPTPPDNERDPINPPRPEQQDVPLGEDHMDGAGAEEPGEIAQGRDDNAEEQHVQEPPRTGRKAAAIAHDRIYGQARFSNDVRSYPMPPREMQPRKYCLRTVDGHEVAPVTFSPRSTRKEKQAKVRLQAAEANESFPLREQEKSVIKSSLARAKQAVRPNDEGGSSKGSMNTIQEPNIIFGTGNLLHFPGPIAHCVSSDFQMSAGIAEQIREAYLTLQPTLKSIETPQVGASVSMSIPSQNKSIFNLVTKS